MAPPSGVGGLPYLFAEFIAHSAGFEELGESFVHFKKGLVAFDFDRRQIKVGIGYIGGGGETFGKSFVAGTYELFGKTQTLF